MPIGALTQKEQRHEARFTIYFVRARTIAVLYGVSSPRSGSELGSSINAACTSSLPAALSRVMCCVFGLPMFSKILAGDSCR
uniref:Uncharacterized protein n=1 Tax=Physcomitrium patens TaxID=3218 RepID=A0A2K1IV95_PHYPA|nr:hypothetical protein PHYPA_025146 [Physcomitrium patens]